MRKCFLFFLLLFFPIFVNAQLDTARCSVVMDMDSGRVLYEKNAHEPRLIASITKIMTAVIAIENGNLDDVVTVGEEVLKMYGSNIYLELGETMTLRNLLYGLMLRSGNDSAVVIANYIGGTEEKFVQMMNEKAKEIGMTNTVYRNSHGLDEESENYSTAYDMALLSSYANTLEEYKEIVKTKEWKVSNGQKTYLWYNRNKLLSLYDYATGGKTGYTPRAGRTLVTSATKNNMNLTVVTLDDGNEYDTHENLYELFFSRYQKYLILDKNDFSIDKEYFSHPIYLNNSFYYPLTMEEAKNSKLLISLYRVDKFEDDTVIGNVKFIVDNEVVHTEAIYGRNEKETKESLWEKVKSFVRHLFD